MERLASEPNPPLLTSDNSARSHEALAWAHQEGELHARLRALSHENQSRDKYIDSEVPPTLRHEVEKIILKGIIVLRRI